LAVNIVIYGGGELQLETSVCSGMAFVSLQLYLFARLQEMVAAIVVKLLE